MFKLRFRRSMRPMFSDPQHHGKISIESIRDSEHDLYPGVCVALVDARFMGWLMGIDFSKEQISSPLIPSQELVNQISNLLTNVGLTAHLLRVYWYTDRPPHQLVNHLVVRTVADYTQDSGLSTVRAMSEDLKQLSQSHAANHVLLASDDDRIWAAVDEAQLHGLRLYMLCDDSVSNFAQLQKDDPTWARLLAQADRRVVWVGGDVNGRTGSSLGTLNQFNEVSTDTHMDATTILAHIERWWSEEPHEQRNELRDELRLSRNIPQELDRLLLLRLSRELGRPLSWSDKKVMRDGLRHTVLEDESDPINTTTCAGISTSTAV